MMTFSFRIFLPDIVSFCFNYNNLILNITIKMYSTKIIKQEYYFAYFNCKINFMLVKI